MTNKVTPRVALSCYPDLKYFLKVNRPLTDRVATRSKGVTGRHGSATAGDAAVDVGGDVGRTGDGVPGDGCKNHER